METKEYFKAIDRSPGTVAHDWPAGEWDTEPDKVQWPDPVTGLPCIALRHQSYGNWCGYVGVAPGHKFHTQYYGDIAEKVDIHDQVTYAQGCTHTAEPLGICHVPGPGEPDDVWWLGFSCGNMQTDIQPSDIGSKADERYDEFNRKHGMPERTYKNLAFVKAECARLALQLKAVT